MQSSVLSAVVSEFGKMACDTRVSEKCSVICAEIVAIGFHARNTLSSANSPFFVFGGKSMRFWGLGCEASS